MFNPFTQLGTKALAVFESSWMHLFRKETLHYLAAVKLFQFHVFMTEGKNGIKKGASIKLTP